MIKIKKRWEIPESEVTPEPLYRRRREFMQAAGTIGGALLLNPWAAAQASLAIGDYQKQVISTDEEITDEADATSYNNFYEFGTGKIRNASRPMTGKSRSAGNAKNREPMASKTCCVRSRSRSGFTACAASKPGRW